MPSPHPKTTDETLKETFEAIVIALILAFIFRAYVVEAFVIPTGSMAPTLLGQHVPVRCSQCGYRWAVDQSGRAAVDRGGLRRPCPMCAFPQEVPPNTPTRSGDRLLVQKYVYQLAEPARWDVVVFRNPQAFNDDGTPGPKTNYIKRLVGLPNEALQIVDGNVHVRPLDGTDADWTIARKTDPTANRHWEKIQRAAWQPIYHSRYVPLDHGLGLIRNDAWTCPWQPTAATAGRWDLGNPNDGWNRSYRLIQGHGGESASGELTFRWAGYHDRGTRYPYNGTVSDRGVVRRQPIEDVRLAATIAPDTREAAAELRLTTRFEDTPEPVVLRLDGNGKLSLMRPQADEGRQVLATATGVGNGSATRLELWVVDQEILAWVDGRLAFRHAIDLTWDQILQRPAPADRPDVSIRVDGGPVTLHAVELDRDWAYTPALSSDRRNAPFGAMRRSANGKLVEPPPIRVRPGRYFVLGDNSPISSDGRFWNEADPWIQRRMLPEANDWQPQPGYPFVRDYAQVVPRGLMVGRAFFIYFPAPYAVRRGGVQMLPNFGDMRFVH
ncbi:MAG: S26 family signal peptidase [Planctomycetota bacterium]